MTASHEARIARAAELARTHAAARELLNFYRELAEFQGSIYDYLRSNGRTDMADLLSYFPGLIKLVRRAGPQPLADFGAEHLQSPAAQQKLLITEWEDPKRTTSVHACAHFYARVLLQPYAEFLASRGVASVAATTAICPFCSARPVAAVLRGEGEGAKRWLLCSLCSTEWEFRRVLCPNCGEEDRDQLPRYAAPDFGHVRVEACDRCKAYIKSVDLTRDGHAVPVVDELATVALNLWAEERGYTKLEPNLLGL